MSKWRGFVSRLMALASLVEIQKTDAVLVASRMPRVPEAPKPRPAGMATEYERNIKPPKKGKGTRKQRKEESLRMMRNNIAWSCIFRWKFEHSANQHSIRYGSKAHRRALTKLTQ